MKVGDRRMWRMRQTNEPIEVELVRCEPERGWWSVQPIGRGSSYYAHVSELQPVPQHQPQSPPHADST